MTTTESGGYAALEARKSEPSDAILVLPDDATEAVLRFALALLGRDER